MNICRESVESPVLEFVTEVVIPACEGSLVAKKNFVLDPAGENGVKINFIGEKFAAFFLTGSLKPQGPTPRKILLCHKLCQSLTDGPIFNALGKEDVSTSLADIYYLLSLQGMGEEGTLLVNGSANIFYVFGEDGNLRAIYVRWQEGGWALGADLVCADRHRGVLGFQVFSRK